MDETSGRWALLAQWLAAPGVRPHPVPGLSDRRLARWLSQPHAKDLHPTQGPQEALGRSLGAYVTSQLSSRATGRLDERGDTLLCQVVKSIEHRHHGRARRIHLHAGIRRA